MQIKRATLDTCTEATGLVVVIDVLRAFSTAAYAFASGAREILLVGSIEEAFGLRQNFPEYLLMGESDGLKIQGFDLNNSPTELSQQNLHMRGMIQRTSAGTQGIVRSQQAEILLAASFVVARATAQFILQRNPASVTFVITGWGANYLDPGLGNTSLFFGDEDAACADYINQLLLGKTPDPGPYLQRVVDSAPGRLFADISRPDFPSTDLDLCTKLDRFDFAMHVQRRDGLFVMNPIR
jgi:2-phosphosulfolactate phosphatase